MNNCLHLSLMNLEFIRDDEREYGAKVYRGTKPMTKKEFTKSKADVSRLKYKSKKRQKLEISDKTSQD